MPLLLLCFRLIDERANDASQDSISYVTAGTALHSPPCLCDVKVVTYFISSPPISVIHMQAMRHCWCVWYNCCV